ncbi:hypothetical protein [Embleya sp. NPDC050493]|uniref:hypothetical protein n=1 Tax=Embleya sp. NPDC050493 TaxID=3363989 RepID=UPI0037925F5C
MSTTPLPNGGEPPPGSDQPDKHFGCHPPNHACVAAEPADSSEPTNPDGGHPPHRADAPGRPAEPDTHHPPSG